MNILSKNGSRTMRLGVIAEIFDGVADIFDIISAAAYSIGTI